MSEEVTFEYLKGLKDNKEVLLIDVREPSELEQTGRIPGSINIPLGVVEDTLTKSSPEEFQRKFGRHKPTLDMSLVFHCQAGRRSLAALEKVKKLGFLNAKHYAGGYSGWEKEIKSGH